MSRIVNIAVAGAATAALALAASPALAAHGGGGGGGGGGTTAQVVATPSPAAANGALVSVSGCGYKLAPAILRVVRPSGTDSYNVAVWSTGCLDAASFLTAEPGTYSVQVYQTFGTKRSTSTVLEASTTVRVG
jgi:hypothetical protein